MLSDCRIKRVVSELFGENAFILNLNGRDDCLIVDPGLDADAIVSAIDADGWTPAAILNTHGHGDHIAGNGAMKRRWPDAPLIIGRGDAAKLTDSVLNLSADFGFPIVSPPADQTVSEGDRLTLAGFSLLVHEIPGHSSGHVVFIWDEAKPQLVLGGDVLFAGSIGRTDFPDGSFEALAHGIHRHLFTLPDDTIVLPGHGNATTVGEEKRSNPFVGEPAG